MTSRPPTRSSSQPDRLGTDRSGIRLRSRPGRAIISAAVLGSALAYMSDDMLNVALPTVSDDLGVGVTEMQWVVNGYFVTMLSLMLSAGSIGDTKGHRQTFLIGLGIFSGGALVAAGAPTVAVLVAGRGIQGVGAAFVVASGLAMVNGSFVDDERNRAVGVYMGLTAVATAAGPVLGGLLVDLLSWRMIFIAPLAFPFAAAIVTLSAVPASGTNGRRPLDLTGAAFGFIAIAAFSLALIRPSASWDDPVRLIALVVAGAAASAFLLRQHRSTDPILPLGLFRSRTFSGGNAVTLLSFLVSAGAFLFVAVQLQTTLGYRPARAGAALVPVYLIMLIGSPLAGRLADGVGPRIPVVVGNLVFAAGVWWLSFVDAGSGFFYELLPALVLLSIGLATLGAPLTSATLGAVGADLQGTASGVNNTVGQMAGLLMIAVLPALAGLSGQGFDSPEFADGYRRAMQICAALAVAAAAIAGLTLGPRPDPSDADSPASP